MQKGACELCGYIDEIGTVKSYPVFPREIAEQAGVENIEAVRLCTNCYREMENWYSVKIASTTYDNGMKQFRDKSPEEMLKEHEIAYQHFTEYKKGQQRLL